MSYYNAQAEPFEESQGNTSPKASPDELKAFYDMERQQDLQRKLSKRRTPSLWSRKSIRRTSSSSQQPQQTTAPRAGPLTSPSSASLAGGGLASSVDSHGDSVSALPTARSIIPDLLNELPAWYNPPAAGMVKLPLHNPAGPRYYSNIHLSPPANTRPANRPPSVFSPSFPPMASGSLDGRSTSNSPLPTPNSSQTQMVDGTNVPRSRKTSQTARDNVDLLDVSDPWGTPWHHQSPYDVGLSSSPVSFEETSQTSPQQPARDRPRTVSAATTAQNRRKTVTPSPLSQSTSAIHLHVSADRPPTRKLSKRRTLGIFGGMGAMQDLQTRGESPSGPPPTKERRGSVLGRLAKRFSISRKQPQPAAGMEVVRQPSPVKRTPSPEKPTSPEPLMKRVPPPQVDQEPPLAVIPPAEEPPKIEQDRRTSTVSFEGDVAYTMGRLTIANPDPGSAESTPVQHETSLPPEERSHERFPTDETLTREIIPSPEPLSRSPEPVSLPAITVHHSPEPIRSPQLSSPEISSRPQTTSPRPASPPPPPAPEKPTNFPNDHRSSVPRMERSVSPPSEPSRPRVQSPVEKRQPPPPPSPKLPAVPFPEGYGPPSRDSPPQLPEITADISPYSVSSMLVNPPTPYTADTPMPDDVESLPPPVPSKRSSRDPSPSQVAVTGRETETFRLVRSASGTVYASSETIRAGADQWEVVESPSSRNKNKSQEGGSRREQRRQAKEAEEPKVRSERSRKRVSPEAAPAVHRRAPIPEALVSREDEGKGARSRSPKEERKSDRKSPDPRLNKPQPAPPPPSKPVRPISEVPTAADMNAMKAREAWDMERLWKARSMSGMEPNNIVAAAPPVPISKGEDPHAVYGSSRTAFLVSTPFQAQDTNGLPPRLANPLPEPPRESPYQPAPLSLPEYWSKQHSVTTAH
ncbi:hypothetical protein FB45DRAFT_917841 [Roridomyces roridus]|uniref:Uncharacterized protein n=1 Tax=Roridomyces roridus TaxID=1738132 RepID=A0AAD7BV54_9AGAR|nr:hypothetical protein FB45DRAFT_917841 [Roridomyces roridus]